jgi:hypothetical protein
LNWWKAEGFNVAWASFIDQKSINFVFSFKRFSNFWSSKTLDPELDPDPQLEKFLDQDPQP